MAKVKIVLNQAGLREYLNSAGVQALLSEQAEQVADRAGDGYEAREVASGAKRAHATVEAETVHAIRDNAKHNTLLKALGGA